MLNIQLLSDKILVEVEDNEITNPSGLIVSKTSDTSDVRTGKVKAIGPGKVNEDGTIRDMKVMLEDTIWFQYGTKITVEGKNYILLSESADVIGIHMAPERN